MGKPSGLFFFLPFLVSFIFLFIYLYYPIGFYVYIVASDFVFCGIPECEKERISGSMSVFLFIFLVSFNLIGLSCTILICLYSFYYLLLPTFF